jgi:hypothetical protein
VHSVQRLSIKSDIGEPNYTLSDDMSNGCGKNVILVQTKMSILIKNGLSYKIFACDKYNLLVIHNSDVKHTPMRIFIEIRHTIYVSIHFDIDVSDNLSTLNQ